MEPNQLLAFRDADGVAELEEKVFGAKASKSKLRRKAYKAVLKRLSSIQEKNGYTQAEMVAAVANFGTVVGDHRLSVTVKTKRGAK